MQKVRPYVLTVAGHDPSSGAGITADIKTFEQLNVYGLSICTGLTLQTENKFNYVQWRQKEDVLNEIKVILDHYPVKAVKFGIIPDLDLLFSACKLIKGISAKTYIIVDTIIRSTTGSSFADFSDRKELLDCLAYIDLITPNSNEIRTICREQDLPQFLLSIPVNCSVLVKGGHDKEYPGTDILYTSVGTFRFEPGEKTIFPKHGSGCVLSASITANLAKGNDLREACQLGKKYAEKFLMSNSSLLGFHA